MPKNGRVKGFSSDSAAEHDANQLCKLRRLEVAAVLFGVINFVECLNLSLLTELASYADTSAFNVKTVAASFQSIEALLPR